MKILYDKANKIIEELADNNSDSLENKINYILKLREKLTLLFNKYLDELCDKKEI